MVESGQEFLVLWQPENVRVRDILRAMKFGRPSFVKPSKRLVVNEDENDGGLS
jgi:hypothetical protein